MSRPPLVHVDRSLAGATRGERVALGDEQWRHLASALRLGPGDRVELADGAGGHAVGELVDRGVRLGTAASVTPPDRPALRVVHGLPKGRKLDEVVRATVELGVDELVPLAADRSVRRPQGGRAERAVERWRAVARAACEQSRRVHRPAVGAVATVGDLAVEGLWLLATPGARALPAVLADADRAALSASGARVTVAVGPEGGWSEREIERLTRAGARPVGLGATVLRTEHAAAAALAVVAAWAGRWCSGPGGPDPAG